MIVHPHNYMVLLSRSTVKTPPDTSRVTITPKRGGNPQRVRALLPSLTFKGKWFILNTFGLFSYQRNTRNTRS